MIKTTVVNIAGAAAETYPRVCRHQIFWQRCKKEDSHFDKSTGNIGYPHTTKDFQLVPPPYVKTNSKRIIEINVKAEAIKVSEKTGIFVVVVCCYFGLEKDSINQHDVKIINKLDLQYNSAPRKTVLTK